jgi:hypothetical protein
MPTQLILEQQVTANPGDEFVFRAKPGPLSMQYHVRVDGVDPGVVIGVWGPNNPGVGKARNKPGQTYVDRTLSKGNWRITVEGASGPFLIVVTKNSWFHGVFRVIPESPNHPESLPSWVFP